MIAFLSINALWIIVISLVVSLHIVLFILGRHTQNLKTLLNRINVLEQKVKELS